MIRCIAAIDSEGGLAVDKGIPWHLPLDQLFFRQMTRHAKIVMGYRTYQEFDRPLPERQNYVVVRPDTPQLRTGFEPIEDVRAWLHREKGDVWVIGGAGLFAATIDLAEELYLTHVEGDFHCTKFFPPYERDFKVIFQSAPLKEDDITFHFSIYKRQFLIKTAS